MPKLIKHYVIHELRYVKINLMDYMDLEQYQKGWRYRINLIRVFFLDANGAIIPNSNNIKDGLFSMEVKYPNMFYEMDSNKVPHLFVANQLFCRSVYKKKGEFVEDCTTSENLEFSENGLAPSPNGTYTLILLDTDALNMTRFQKLKIEISGSYVPFPAFKARRFNINQLA